MRFGIFFGIKHFRVDNMKQSKYAGSLKMSNHTGIYRQNMAEIECNSHDYIFITV